MVRYYKLKTNVRKGAVTVEIADMCGIVEFACIGSRIIVDNQISAEGKKLLDQELSYRKQVKETLCYVPAHIAF